MREVKGREAKRIVVAEFSFNAHMVTKITRTESFNLIIRIH